MLGTFVECEHHSTNTLLNWIANQPILLNHLEQKLKEVTPQELAGIIEARVKEQLKEPNYERDSLIEVFAFNYSLDINYLEAAQKFYE